MALINCPECKTEVSSEALACPKCGVRIKPKSKVWRYVIGVPVGLAVAFVLYGMTIPKNIADGNRAYQMCREMYAKGQVDSMATCEEIEAKIKRGEGPK